MTCLGVETDGGLSCGTRISLLDYIIQPAKETNEANMLACEARLASRNLKGNWAARCSWIISTKWSMRWSAFCTSEDLLQTPWRLWTLWICWVWQMMSRPVGFLWIAKLSFFFFFQKHSATRWSQFIQTTLALCWLPDWMKATASTSWTTKSCGSILILRPELPAQILYVHKFVYKSISYCKSLCDVLLACCVSF